MKMPERIVKKARRVGVKEEYVEGFGADFDDLETWRLYSLRHGEFIRCKVLQLLGMDGNVIAVVDKNFEFKIYRSDVYPSRLLYLPKDLVLGYNIREGMVIDLILLEILRKTEQGDTTPIYSERLVEGPMDIRPRAIEDVAIPATTRAVVRKYYAERRGAKLEPMDFETLKKVFLFKFEELERDFYFREATGYECVDQGIIHGTWGNDPEAFFFLKLRMRNIWPIRKNIVNYDELKLFTVIEFLYDYVSEPQKKW